MSTRRTYEIERVIPKLIKTITKVELSEIVEQLILMIKEKIEKFKSSMSNCVVTNINEKIIIKDEFGLNSQINELAQAFGMKIRTTGRIEKVSGTIYHIEDDCLDLIYFLKPNHSLFSLESSQSIDLKKKIRDMNVEMTFSKRNKSLLEMLRADDILSEIITKSFNNEELKIEEHQKILETRMDNRVISNNVVSTNSDEHKYNSTIEKFKEIVNKTIDQHKKNMVNGTIKTIEVRAKKMGYNVERKTIDHRVQLVLYRGR